MGALSPIHLLILAVVLLLLFGGRGRFSSMMGDAAKGIKAFKEGLKDEHDTPPQPPQATPTLPHSEAEKDPIVR